MYFSTKNYLKNNRNHAAKQTEIAFKYFLEREGNFLFCKGSHRAKYLLQISLHWFWYKFSFFKSKLSYRERITWRGFSLFKIKGFIGGMYSVYTENNSPLDSK